MSSSAENQKKRREAELEEIRNRRLDNVMLTDQSIHDDSFSGSQISSPSSTNGIRTSNGVVAAYKAKLENHSTNHIVVNMQDHFYKQRKEKSIAREKQKEAVSILHSYHGEAEMGRIFMKKDSDKLYTSEDQELYNAVDENVDKAAKKVSMIVSKRSSDANVNINDRSRTPSPTQRIIPRPTSIRRMNMPKVYISVIHDTHGILLLKRQDVDFNNYSTQDEDSIYELPGGLVEEYELNAAERVCGDNDRICVLVASKIAAARLLYDTIGIDVRKDLLRLQPTSLRNQSLMGQNKELNCEINGTLFFNLFVSDRDLIKSDESPRTNMDSTSSIIKLNLNTSFSGYEFEKNPFEAAEKVRLFSQSICYDALQLAITRNEIAEIYNSFDVAEMNITPPKPEIRKSLLSCFAPCFG